jgi:regulator of sigma E protease
MGLVLSIALFLLLICALVAAHELGHLLIARANGIFCEAFSIGIGPVLLEKKDKHGTKWRFSLFPIGGYVKMLGDADISSVKEEMPVGYTEEDMEKMSPHRKKPWQRLLIAAGGPLANFLFAIVVLFGLATINGAPFPDNSITVASENSLAFTSGLRNGDHITQANGKDIKIFYQLRDVILESSGKELSLTIKRGEEIKDIEIKMYEEKAGGEIVPVQTLGIYPGGYIYKKLGIIGAMAYSVHTTYTIARDNIKGIFNVAIGKVSPKNVGSVVSIFKISSESAEAGIANFIMMMAMISVILGAVNLLPIPVLDGGTILISAIEWIIGRRLNKKFVEAIFTVGLFIVVGLMVLGLWNDISKCKFFVILENLFK